MPVIPPAVSDARLLIDTLRFWPEPDAASMTARWAQSDASAIARVAESEGASLWLHRRLRALGIAVPGNAADTIAAAARAAAARALRVDEEAFAALSILDGAGIAVVPLKAAVLRRITARVPLADARATSDVDLLVETAHAARAWTVLSDRGYVARRPAGQAHHLPGLFGAFGVAVELHTSTSVRVSPSEAWRRAMLDGAMADFAGASRPVPGDTELLWHAVTHVLANVEESGRTLCLRGWLDVAALLAAGAPIDWDRINVRLRSAECARPSFARAWLRTASDLSGRSLPVGTLGSEGDRALDLHRLLSWRLRVATRHATGGRWAEKLAEEGARGEGGLSLQTAHRASGAYGRFRHAIACGAARTWWLMRR